MSDKKTRVLILGGGFGGLYAALQFQKRKDPHLRALAHTQTGISAAQWNRARLSSPEKMDNETIEGRDGGRNRIAA
jgi:cation diffusion facilitator CzcD-associated flavoprotein CzcO